MEKYRIDKFQPKIRQGRPDPLTLLETLHLLDYDGMSDVKMWRWIGLDSLIGGGERKILRTPVLPGRKLRGPAVSPKENETPRQVKNVDLISDIENNFDFKMWRWKGSETLIDGGGVEPNINQTPVITNKKKLSSSSFTSTTLTLVTHVTLPPDFDVHVFMEYVVTKMNDDSEVDWNFNEITAALRLVEGLPEWFANYLVNSHLIRMPRSSASLFRRLMEHINNDVFYDLVLMETKIAIENVLKEMTTFKSPKLKRYLENLRNWLGMITYGMNRPLPETDPIGSMIHTYNTNGQKFYYA